MPPQKIDRHPDFLRCFMAHEFAIRAYVRRLVLMRVDADDVMQEVALVLWERFGEFREGGTSGPGPLASPASRPWPGFGTGGATGWCSAWTWSTCLRRRTCGTKQPVSRQLEALESCMEKLEPPQRELLVAAYQPKARIQAVAAKSGRSVPGFYQWLYRVRTLLLDCVLRGLITEDVP